MPLNVYPVNVIALLFAAVLSANVALALLLFSVTVSPLITPLIEPWLLIDALVVLSYILSLTVGFVPQLNAFAVIFALKFACAGRL